MDKQLNNMKYLLIVIGFFCISGTIIYQAVRHDTTLTGEGITGSELKVDTTIIATVNRTSGGRSTYITPSQITSDQDNYNPTGFASATHVRLSGDNGIRAVTSMAAMGGAVTDVFEKTLINVGSYALYFPMDHPDGTAANRFTGNSGSFFLFPGATCKIWYDMASSRWRVSKTEYAPQSRSVNYYYSAGSNTSGDYGALGFLAIASGFNYANQATTSIPAAWGISTESTTTGGGEIYMARGPSHFSAFASAHVYAETYLTIPTISDGSNTYTSELQISASPTSANLENNNMFGIRYSHGINGGDWELFSQSNTGTESVADLNVAVASNTSYTLRIEVDKAKSEALAYVNGAYAGRVTGTLPNSVICGARIVHLKSAGSSSRILNVHSFAAGAIY